MTQDSRFSKRQPPSSPAQPRGTGRPPAVQPWRSPDALPVTPPALPQPPRPQPDRQLYTQVSPPPRTPAPPVVRVPAPTRDRPRRPPQSPPPAAPPTPPVPAKATKKARFIIGWQVWVMLSLATVLGAGGLGAALLFKLPALPNCPSIFWPTASASLRVYCAQLAANKKTVDDLLEAIELVNGLPENHPMHGEVNRYTETWADEILNLAQDSFHRGDLEGAIAIARRIPMGTAARDLVAERVSQWREVWAEGETIYAKAETAMLDQDLRLAFSLATQLLDVPNRYWQTTKYEELGDLITAAREDGNRLGQIQRLARRGGLSNLLQAIEMAQEVQRISPAYPAAQRLIARLGQDMLTLAEAALDREDFAAAMEIVEQVPEIDALQPELQDFRTLAQARAQSWLGGTADLESAVSQAQRIRRDRPLYGRAQSLIGRWQLEIRDVVQLNQARRLANLDTLPDLRAAIAEARQVPSSNPRGDEAQTLIQQWTTQIETVEDRPIVDQATAVAGAGDLTAAIALARQVRSGRALYAEAQEQIQGWTRQLQRNEDMPILNEARRLASFGNLGQAIGTADQIQSGRVLHADAQADIRLWRGQLQARASLQEAQRVAASGTPNALLSGIRLASQVPDNTDSYAEADRFIAQWSQGVLQSAQVLAGYDLDGAIALLAQLPRHPATAATAQQQLAAWRQARTPQSLPTLPPSASTAPVPESPMPSTNNEADPDKN